MTTWTNPTKKLAARSPTKTTEAAETTCREDRAPQRTTGRRMSRWRRKGGTHRPAPRVESREEGALGRGQVGRRAHRNGPRQQTTHGRGPKLKRSRRQAGSAPDSSGQRLAAGQSAGHSSHLSTRLSLPHSDPDLTQAHSLSLSQFVSAQLTSHLTPPPHSLI